LVNWYKKGRTILDFNEARDDGVAVALCSRQITTSVPHHFIRMLFLSSVEGIHNKIICDKEFLYSES